MSPGRRKEAAIGAGLAAATLLWLAAALSAPLLERAGAAAPAEIARSLFSLVCHQIPERSFRLAGAPLPLCARCTGLYAGFLIGCAALALRRASAKGPSPAPPAAGLLAAAALPTLLEAAAEGLGIWGGSSTFRALAGLLLAAPLAPLAAAAARELPAEVAGELNRLRRHGGRSHAGTC